MNEKRVTSDRSYVDHGYRAEERAGRLDLRERRESRDEGERGKHFRVSLRGSVWRIREEENEGERKKR